MFLGYIGGRRASQSLGGEGTQLETVEPQKGATRDHAATAGAAGRDAVIHGGHSRHQQLPAGRSFRHLQRPVEE